MMLHCSENIEYDNFKLACLTALLTFCATRFTSVFSSPAIMGVFRVLNMLFAPGVSQQQNMGTGMLNAMNEQRPPGQRPPSLRSQRDVRDTLYPGTDFGLE